MQNVNHASAADTWGIVNACVREIVVVLELFRPLVCQNEHVFLAAKVQTAGRARLDARWLESFADAVGAERAFVNALGFFVEFRNVERAAADAVAAADALVLLEIDDTVRILNDRPIGRARG